MPIKAIFLEGQTEITVNGLHQWDYGQYLTIEAPNLPALVEVHFACIGMPEAVVRSCSALNGTLTAAIPDECLTQTAPIVAWVYSVGLTDGETVLTVLLPIIPRTRPAQAPTVPPVITDKYTELVDEINTLVERLTDGDVTVSFALDAKHAQIAQSAGTADWADTAQSADRAEYADLAGKANNATAADKLSLLGYQEFTQDSPLPQGVYMIMDVGTTFLLDTRAEYSAPYFGPINTAIATSMFRMGVIEKNGGIWLQRYHLTGSSWEVDSTTGGVSGVDFGIKYLRIATFPVG